MSLNLIRRPAGLTSAVRRGFGGLLPRDPESRNAWRALWAMMVGFFMILVDATIVAVANPSLMDQLGADYDAVIWVTSAYLLAYAVPLLVAGRLGDRFGPKNLYLIGLSVFTAASLWCGLSDTIGMLVAARVLQGVGASLLTPQTLSTITRIFPADRRGVAMGVWGATAGVATLVGPLAGGFLVDGLGWQWIFFVNVPVGVFGIVLAARLVPELPTNKQPFDVPGVLLSGIGMFMIVYALQEGQAHEWAPWVWGAIAGGVGFMAAFLIWQSVNTAEPLVPLAIFGDRDFALSNLGVATIGFVVTAMMVPVMFYAQAVCGLTPTRSGLLMAPMAILSGVLAPFVGKIVDRSHPRPVVGFGFSLLAISVTWLSIEMTPTTPIWRIAVPLAVTGVSMAFIWSPLAATATRNLAIDRAGAGSGVYNATRQVGSVLGSAGIAAFMTWRIGAVMPPAADQATDTSGVMELPSFLHESFAAAMSQAMLLPAFIALFGVVLALFLVGFESDPVADDVVDPDASAGLAVDYGGDETFVDDDDDYLEYTVSWDEPGPVPVAPDAAESPTDPIPARATPPSHTPRASRYWQNDTAAEPETDERESWRAVLDLLDDVPSVPATSPEPEPIGHAHNGFHVDDQRRFKPTGRRPLAEPRSSVADAYEMATGHHYRRPRHRRSDEANESRSFWFQSHGRHSRDEDPDDRRHSGRHSLPWNE
ncbi:DHA2 family efflux MFS transporter permease subunit [Mycolicibacterium sp. XJ879]